jgi:hypothetical protein
MESSNFCTHVMETKISSKIFTHAMETPMICHNYKIYHKNRICMQEPARVHVVQWLGEVFMLSLWTIYAISVKYLCYLRFAQKKTWPQFMACVPCRGWDVGPGVWLTRGERFDLVHTYLGCGWTRRCGPTRSQGWSVRASSTIWKPKASNIPYIYKFFYLWRT